MTQPVQEPTQGRVDQAQEFRTRQLFRRPSPAASGGGGGLAAIYTQSVNQTIASDTDTELSFEEEEFNGLGVVTSDFIHFTPPTIGANPTFLVITKMEVRGRSGPMGKWLFAGNWQFPFEQVGATYSDLGEDQNSDKTFGITDSFLWLETSDIVVSAWQTSAGAVSQDITNCLLQITYLGQSM